MACVSTKPETRITEQAGGSARSSRVEHGLLKVHPAVLDSERISRIAKDQFPINFLPEDGTVLI